MRMKGAAQQDEAIHVGGPRWWLVLAPLAVDGLLHQRARKPITHRADWTSTDDRERRPQVLGRLLYGLLPNEGSRHTYLPRPLFKGLCVTCAYFTGLTRTSRT